MLLRTTSDVDDLRRDLSEVRGLAGDLTHAIEVLSRHVRDLTEPDVEDADSDPPPF